MKQQLDNDTLLAFTQGDTRAFAKVYEIFYPEIYYFSYSFLQNKFDAEDIATQVFVALFQRYMHLSGESNLKAFLYISTRNACFNFLRSKKRSRISLKDLNQQAGDANLDIEDPTTQHRIIEGIVLKQVYDEVEKLPGQCQRIFKMLFIEGLKPAEVADRLSITPETVRSQKRRALDLLRIRLADNQLALAWLAALSVMESVPVLMV